MALTDLPRLMAVNSYFKLILEGKQRIEASEIVSKVVLSRGVWGARILRGWANIYFNNLMLPMINQGNHIKVKSLIHDEDVRAACRTFLRSVKPDEWSFQKWKEYVNFDLS